MSGLRWPSAPGEETCREPARRRPYRTAGISNPAASRARRGPRVRWDDGRNASETRCRCGRRSPSSVRRVSWTAGARPAPTARTRRPGGSRTPNSPAVVQPSVPARLRRGLGAAVPLYCPSWRASNGQCVSKGRLGSSRSSGCCRRGCEGNAETTTDADPIGLRVLARERDRTCDGVRVAERRPSGVRWSGARDPRSADRVGGCRSTTNTGGGVRLSGRDGCAGAPGHRVLPGCEGRELGQPLSPPPGGSAPARHKAAEPIRRNVERGRRSLTNHASLQTQSAGSATRVLRGVASLSSRLDGKPRSGVALRSFRSPLELAGSADGAHDRKAGWFEPVGVLTRERGPASRMPVARAAALAADQQHIPRHPGANLRGFAASAQGAKRTWPELQAAVERRLLLDPRLEADREPLVCVATATLRAASG